MITDHCFAQTYVQPYKNGRILAIEDIYTAGVSQCHIDLLAQFQVRANLVVPILQDEGLWGLLIAHHCSQPRQWQQLEINLLKELATQAGIAIKQAQLYQQLEQANQELQRLAVLDGLTQLANRRCFDEYLNSEWQRLAREQAPLSLILGDIDFFKPYNDTYGHQAGDECLRAVASAIQRTVKRSADLVARYGGEEFAIILPNTMAEGAIQVAEKIRAEVKALAIAHVNSPTSQQITVSLGIASVIPTPESSPATLIAAADTALYQAKAAGRDRCSAHN
jgi:diguanylate cyclase (GGDEF)-like protein